MPESMLALRIIPFEKFDGGVFNHRTGDIPILAVYLGCEHIGRETRTDAFCYLQGRYAGLELLHAAIWKCYVDHMLLFSQTRGDTHSGNASRHARRFFRAKLLNFFDSTAKIRL